MKGIGRILNILEFLSKTLRSLESLRKTKEKTGSYPGLDF
jgi:hypothetical protein